MLTSPNIKSIMEIVMNFGQSISTCMSKYATFKGRASRSEYWWFFLFTVLIGWGAEIVAAIAYADLDPTGEILSLMVSLVFILPGIAAGTRRLHDIGKSGWWQLLYLTIIGGILVIVWLATDTKSDGDKYNIET